MNAALAGDPTSAARRIQAIEWVKKCPNPMRTDSEIEIRQIFAAEDFGDALTPELREQEERLRKEVQSRASP